MKKKKVGLWLPYRESLTEFTIEKPGMFLKEIRDSIIEELKKDKSIELWEDLDFRKATIKEGKAYLGELCLNDLGLFFWFGEIDRSEKSHHIEILDIIAKDTKVVNSPFGLRIGLDKYKTSSFLKEHDILVPDFVLVSKDNIEPALELLKKARAVVLKPRLGSFGVGIVKVEDEQTLIDIIDYSNRETHFIESFIPPDLKHWCGINIIGGKFVYAYSKEKQHIKGGWKISDRHRKGGDMIIYNPNDEQLKIAQKIAEIFKLDLVGVDMIKGLDGKYYVVDVNTFPGLYPEMFVKINANGGKLIADMIKAKLQ